jgi:CheY-like chemotaxis protein
MRVLAAEDNRANRLILKRMLSGLDIELELVEDGAAAVEAFERRRPDLILMDISMPTMDGTEATRRIRAQEGQGTRVPIVAVTAHSLPGDAESFHAAGMDRHLAKPMRKDDLREVVLAHVPEDARSPDAEAG